MLSGITSSDTNLIIRCQRTYDIYQLVNDDEGRGWGSNWKLEFDFTQFKDNHIPDKQESAIDTTQWI